LSDADRAGVLITRPEPAAHETARLVATRGFRPVLAPMLVIAPRQWPRPPRAMQAILVTSANALPALAACDRATQLLAVGDATAAQARACGFTHVVSAGRDAAALVELVEATCRPEDGPLLLASGAGQGLELDAELRQRGFTLRRRIAYRADPATTLPEPARQALEAGVVHHAMFFSAATARAFARCMIGSERQLDAIEALAMSQPTSRALAHLPWLRIRIASHPNQDELVALLP